MNPSLPVLYGLLKLHKMDFFNRPVVSYVTTPAYKLCKYVNHILPDTLDFHSKYAIKNSLELVIKNHQIIILHNLTDTKNVGGQKNRC